MRFRKQGIQISFILSLEERNSITENKPSNKGNNAELRSKNNAGTLPYYIYYKREDLLITYFKKSLQILSISCINR